MANANHAGGYVQIRPIKGGSPQLEHRVVMERYLERPLQVDEHVHHVNGDKADNRIENLEIVDPREHTRRHHYGKPKRPETRARIVALREQGLTNRQSLVNWGSLSQTSVGTYKLRTVIRGLLGAEKLD